MTVSTLGRPADRPAFTPDAGASGTPSAAAEAGPAPTIAVLIPCYNEELRLNLAAFGRFLRSESRCRLLFVNDGSRDGTLKLLRRLEQEHARRVDVIDLSRNSGKAEAVRCGVRYALERGADYVGYWDADLATPLTPDEAEGAALRVVQAQIEWLEAEIDALNARLEPLTSFILPGGKPEAAALHLARAVIRRAERAAAALAEQAQLNPAALAYLNRLSDFLFVAARFVNKTGGGDVLWVPGASRT